MKYSTHLKKYIHKTIAFASGVFLFSFNILLAQGPTTNPNPTPAPGSGGSVATNLSGKTLQALVTDFVVKTGQYILTFLVALTLLVFLFGLMKYMYKGQSSDTARSEGRQLMLWGVIGLFVMTSVWGLVAIVASTVGHTGVVIPQFK
jgi:hypothetical protein